MMGAMLLLLLSSAGPQNAFSFRVEVLRDTFYQMEPVVVKLVLKNESSETYYLDQYNAIYDGLEMHVYDERGDTLEPKIHTEILRVPLHFLEDIEIMGGDSVVEFYDYQAGYSDSLGIVPGRYVVRARDSLRVVGYGVVELSEVEDTFWVVEPEGEEREAFEFLRKFYSPSMGYFLKQKYNFPKGKTRYRYYLEFLQKFPHSIYTPLVLSLYASASILAGKRSEWLEARKRLITEFPDTYEAYTGAMQLAGDLSRKMCPISFFTLP